MSNHYVSVKCTTNNEEMWVPASSAWPSVLIIICFTALYFWYLSWKYETRNEFNSIIKVNCTINFVGLMMILTIAFIAVYYKWAVRNAVWVGSCIGIGGAIWDGDFRIPWIGKRPTQKWRVHMRDNTDRIGLDPIQSVDPIKHPIPPQLDVTWWVWNDLCFLSLIIYP